MTFDDFFAAATRSEREPNGRVPYPFQTRFATDDALPHLLRAPTGAGKTATAVLGWLYRWQHRDQFPGTPRRLVYCLPMRVLVEQSARESEAWLANLKLDIPVHVLMGGIETEKWFHHPERPAILIGTQDMLLSRALNRGYAASRFHWPIDFGLLNNDCLWVFDEPQLMASGVSTSAQLAGLRHTLKSFGSCPSVWMSATLEPAWLDTVDFRGTFTAPPLELDEERDYDPARPLHKRMTAEKTLSALNLSASKDGKDVAKAVHARHQAGTQTLVILNTVDRAKAVFAELQKLVKKATSPELLLVHSRFRPHERKKLNEQLQEKNVGDRIIVATQVVEAGVDISSRTLVTELAPWASLVQRMGRCNRTGDDGPGVVLWVDVEEKQSAPYTPQELAFARGHVQALEGQPVSPKALDDYKKAHEKPDEPFLRFEHRHVLRRRDLLDLFDTSPDLSGNDIDIQRFVRGDDESTDVQVYWRDGPPEPLKEPKAAIRRQQMPRREELCNVPIGDFKKFLEADRSVYRWDFLDETWKELSKRDANSVIPGQMFWIPSREGGYDPFKGWDASSTAAVKAVPFEEPLPETERNDTGFDSDDHSRFQWRSIAGHTDEVAAELEAMLSPERGLPLTESERRVLEVAIRWHDWGKAHAVFQSAVKADDRPADWQGRADVAKAPDGSWQRGRRVLENRTPTVSRFRHELASALGILTLIENQQPPPGWQELSPQEQDLALYLIAAHHGKVRLTIRAMPEEKPTPANPEDIHFAAGVWDGDKLPATDLGNGTITGEVTLDLSPMLLGENSWTARVLALREKCQPFRLAYLEALVRAADCRASAKADHPKEARRG